MHFGTVFGKHRRGLTDKRPDLNDPLWPNRPYNRAKGYEGRISRGAGVVCRLLPKPLQWPRVGYIDGRLQPDDVGLLKRLLTPHAVIALDDFEGLEKGVWNAQQLDLSNRVLVYPPESVPGAQDDSSLALILPGLKFTAQ